MTNTFIAKLILAIEEQRPKRATGMYITSHGFQWAFRTNERKFPKNFVPFDERREVTR